MLSCDPERTFFTIAVLSCQRFYHVSDVERERSYLSASRLGGLLSNFLVFRTYLVI